MATTTSHCSLTALKHSQTADQFHEMLMQGWQAAVRAPAQTFACSSLKTHAQVHVSCRCRDGCGNLVPRFRCGFCLLHITTIESCGTPHELCVRALLCNSAVRQERNPVSLRNTATMAVSAAATRECEFMSTTLWSGNHSMSGDRSTPPSSAHARLWSSSTSLYPDEHDRVPH